MKKLEHITKLALQETSETIRSLAIDAINESKSGHIGLPLGCAEIGAYLYGYFLKISPSNLSWVNRDRFILSAGHGSLLQYICLHLIGYNITLKDIKKYRKGGSITPSHPEFGRTVGVETTTGADGQGVGIGVGQALGLKILQSKFNTTHQKIINNKVVILAGDGCIMEGISSEACSLAAHLKLDNLILIYDKNETTLDGYLSEISTENIPLRYEAYGWEVIEINGHDFDEIHQALEKTRFLQVKPLFIICHTIIGRGVHSKQGTPDIHSGGLSDTEIKETKKQLGRCEEVFFIGNDVKDYFNKRKMYLNREEKKWDGEYKTYIKNKPKLHKEYKRMSHIPSTKTLERFIKKTDITTPLPTRIASQRVINSLARIMPSFYGGSADLAKSDGTYMENYSIIAPPTYTGRNIKYGVREFAMGSMAVGMAQIGMFIPFIGTFLVFSDYMRHAIRMAAMMRSRVIFQLTHDSIFVGEDGPTHQPIEHIASLRAIPNLQVIRPADHNEVRMAWIAALSWDGPTALILSRQEVPCLNGTDVSFNKGLGKGAYLVKNSSEREPNITLLATGSEVSLALEVANLLEKQKYITHVVSMPSWEIFEKQNSIYKKSLICKKSKIISIEAGASLGWHKYVGSDGLCISVDCFGMSGSKDYLSDRFGFTAKSILSKILDALRNPLKNGEH